MPLKNEQKMMMQKKSHIQQLFFQDMKQTDMDEFQMMNSLPYK